MKNTLYRNNNQNITVLLQKNENKNGAITKYK